jgi:hypothetical protein
MSYNQSSISLFNYQESLRRLAKSIYWQSIYNAKEYGFLLFENRRDLTSLQVDFLHLLGYYSNIISDVAAGVVSDKVLEHDIYIDAYYFYKRKHIQDEKKRTKTEATTNRLQDKIKKPGLNSDQWVFK